MYFCRELSAHGHGDYTQMIMMWNDE